MKYSIFVQGSLAVFKAITAKIDQTTTYCPGLNDLLLLE